MIKIYRFIDMNIWENVLSPYLLEHGVSSWFINLVKNTEVHVYTSDFSHVGVIDKMELLSDLEYYATNGYKSKDAIQYKNADSIPDNLSIHNEISTTFMVGIKVYDVDQMIIRSILCGSNVKEFMANRMRAPGDMSNYQFHILYNKNQNRKNI